MNVVVSPPDIKFSKKGAASKAVDSLWDERGYVTVLLGPFVDWAVVLNWAELTILFLYEEEICGVRAP